MAIEILDGGTIAGLRRVADQLKNPRPLLLRVGRRAGLELRTWFIGRNLASDKLQGRRGTGFWRNVATSVTAPEILAPDKVRVSVTDYRFNQKVYGGPIIPKRAGALTIPVAPEARGLTVSVFQSTTGIELFLLRKKGGVLSNLLAGNIPGSANRFKVYYVLSKGVDQDPDPEALPPRDKFNAAILDEADKTLRQSINNTGGR